MPSCVRIEMFGGLQIIPASDGGTPVTVPPYRAGLLLAVVALSPGRSFTRDELIEKLWPDADVEDGRRRLRQTLHELRAILEPLQEPGLELLVTTRASVQLNSRHVVTDVLEFDRALKSVMSGHSQSHISAVQTAVDLYKGDLLPGFYLEPIQAEQQRLEAALHLALADLSRQQAEAGNLLAAVEALHRLTVLDPIAEQAHCDLMRLYAQLGRHSDVMRQFQVLKNALHEELNESPHDSTRKLVDQLRQERPAPLPIASFTTDNSNEPQSSGAYLPIPEQADATSAHTVEPDTELSQSDSHPFAAHYVNDATFKKSSPLPNRRILIAITCAVCSLCLMAFGLKIAGRGTRHLATHNSGGFGLITPRPGLETWEQRYQPAPDERDSEPTAIAVDPLQDVYVAGFVQTRDRDVDYLVLKYDSHGALLWKAYYDGPSHDVDRARAIAIDCDGNVLVTGDSDNGKGNGYTHLSGLDYATIKLNGKTGERIWAARYNSKVDGEDRPIGIAVDSACASYVTGTSFEHLLPTFEATRAIATVKYDKNGHPLWVQRYGPDPVMDYRATDMKLDLRHGHLFVAAVATGTAMKPSLREQVLLAYDMSGHLLWNNKVDGLNAGIFGDGPARIAVDGDGSVVLAGSQVNPATSNARSTIVRVKYSQDGRELWRDWAPNRIDLNCDSVVGVTIGPNHSVCIGRRTFDVRSNTAWQGLRICGASGKAGRDMTEPVLQGYYDNLVGLAWDSSGNLITCSTAQHHHANGGTSPEPDCITVKYAPNGQELWRSSYPIGGLRALSLCSDGSPVVTGQSHGKDTNDIVTIEYIP